jgi:kynurenine 3-monooxygenase
MKCGSKDVAANIFNRAHGTPKAWKTHVVMQNYSTKSPNFLLRCARRKVDQSEIFCAAWLDIKSLLIPRAEFFLSLPVITIDYETITLLHLKTSQNLAMLNPKQIVIVGCGPAGLLLAHELVRRPDYDVVMLEKRADPRVVALSNPQTLRSFPIALNQRGLSSLQKYDGLQQAVEETGIYLSGICLHNTRSKNYKPPRIIQRETPSLSVDRNRLALTLLRELEQVEPANDTKLSICFETTLEEIVTLDHSANGMKNQICLQIRDGNGGKTAIYCDHLVAADGGKSAVRRHLVEQNLLQSTEKEVPDDYKTIFLSRQSPDGNIRLDDDKLHGWMMRNQTVKIISAPVIEDCISGALIFDKGQDPFQGMTSSQQVLDWFQKECPVLSQFISEKEAAQLIQRPASTTIAVRCNRLNVGTKVVLLGDAAHAMSASVGQGCNAALQDVNFLAKILDQNRDDWNASLEQFTLDRMPDIIAVSDMSDYSVPRVWWMKVEWIVRTILRKVLPKKLATFLLRPLPMELLMETSLPYREVYERTRWWTDRVKNSAIFDSNNLDKKSL